jgi:hypothetical protein
MGLIESESREKRILLDHFASLRLKAFSVDNAWARFIVFLFGDPHLLKSG